MFDGAGTNLADNAGAFDNKIVCVACKPGFKATRFIRDIANAVYHGPGWGVVSCEEISIDGTQGCATVSNTLPNTWFNYCESCIHFYDIYTNKIHYDKCSPPDTIKTIANCFASYDIGPCVICRKGYIRSDKGVCEQIEIPRCNSPFYFENFKNLETDFISKNHRTMSYLLDNRNTVNDGCSQCTDSTNEVLTVINGNDLNLPKTMCTNKALGDRPSIDQCKNYHWDTSKNPPIYTCKVCNTTHILTSNGSCTIKSTNLNNCLMANEIDGVTCLNCEDNFLNVGGVCLVIGSLDPNCKIFDQASKDLPYALCQECNLGFYLDDNNTICTLIDNAKYPNCNKFDKTTESCQGCVTNFMLVSHLDGSQCVLISKLVNEPDFDKNCLEVDQDEFNLNKLVCKTCKVKTLLSPVVNYIPTTNNINLKSHCIKISTEGDPVQKSLCKNYDILFENITNKWDNRSFKCLKCKNTATAYYDELTNLCMVRTPINFCNSFNQFKDKCIGCDDNYVLSVDGQTCDPLPGSLNATQAVNKGYLQYCEPMQSCASKVIYEGLHPHFSALFSCHSCLDTNTIPVVAVRNEENKFKVVSLQEFGIDNKLGSNYLSGSGATSVQCLNPINTSFDIPTPNWSFPSNCGAAVINTKKELSNTDADSNSITSPADIAVYCAGCKPSFKPTYAIIDNKEHEYIISSCDAISNCESSVWFNYCSQCDPEYSYLYDTIKGVQYNQCIQYTENPDCYAVDSSDPSNKDCVFCRKGSFKNADGFCEILNPPRCSLTNFSFRYNYLINDLNSGLYLSRYGIGCHKCDENFVALYTHQEDVVSCTLSPYHKNSQVTVSSKYIYQCLNYRVTQKGDFVCDKCDESCVLSIDGKCVNKVNIENCKLAFNENYCKKCLPGFVLINRACVEVEIENCENYGNDSQSFSQICIECKKGYYKSDNTCVKGEIKNCETYLKKNSCEKCKSGYGLVQNLNEQYYCYPMNDKYRCKNLSYYQLQGGVLECQECAENNVISYNKSEFEQTSCINFDNVNHCAKYDKNKSIALSSYICLECDTNYFLSEGNCIKRLVNLPKCMKYNIKEDKCLECEEGNFLNTVGTLCVSFPEGIPNCLIYLSKEECLTCKSDFYLKDQICYPIREDKKIENCELYEDEEICSKCDSGFLIIEGDCIQSIAKDCGKWKTVSSCETCKNNSFGFKLEEGILNCVQKTVQNCKESEDYEPYLCLVCESGFFVKEGVCTAVINKIINCDIYETETICIKCEKGAALSQDKTSCLKTPVVVQNLDFNCDNSQLVETPQCNTCKPGHYFSNGFCVACSKNTFADGCYNCDPKDQEKCLLCNPGYFMFKNGKCYMNGEIPPEEKEGENTEENNNEGEEEHNVGNGGDVNNGGDGNGEEVSGADLVMDNLMKMIVFFGLVFWN